MFDHFYAFFCHSNRCDVASISYTIPLILFLEKLIMDSVWYHGSSNDTIFFECVNIIHQISVAMVSMVLSIPNSKMFKQYKLKSV